MRELPLPRWPHGAIASVSFTFDLDAEPGLLGSTPEVSERHLSSLSDQRFGVHRGVSRILGLLERLDVRATFYVPGATVLEYPAVVEKIAEAGHEIGHHGHRHLRSTAVGPDEQRSEIELGLEAIERTLGVTPLGYRSPSWEVTPETFALLAECGFSFDSSFMADDRPYVEEHAGSSMLELPVHWTLDDFPFFAFRPTFTGPLVPGAHVLELWRAEVAAAIDDRRHITFTMHPEIIGRGSRFAMLTAFAEYVTSLGSVWIAPHCEVAAAYAE